MSNLSAAEQRLVAFLEKDLPLTSHPYREIARELGWKEEQVAERLQAWKEAKVLRRLAAVLYHRRVGFKANLMGVWRIEPEREQEVGEIMATFPEVSHCYARPGLPDFQYNVYTMIHAHSREEGEAVAARIAEAVKPQAFRLLESTREFKKTSYSYYGGQKGDQP